MTEVDKDGLSLTDYTTTNSDYNKGNNSNNNTMRMVAKESQYVKNQNIARITESSHINFIKTQATAQRYAHKFNMCLDQAHISTYIPRIQFLDCCVYATNDFKTEYLCEKYLNHVLYKKWNDNAGSVDGVAKVNHVLQYHIDTSIAERGGIAEGDEDEDGSDSDDEPPTQAQQQVGQRHNPLEDCVLEGDIPQAFSHFTHIYSKRDHLVCDLQGTLSTITKDGVNTTVFELTDPCIHSKVRCDCSIRKRRCYHRFGATDKGDKGAQDFFKTHQCNAVCEILKIKHKV